MRRFLFSLLLLSLLVVCSLGLQSRVNAVSEELLSSVGRAEEALLSGADADAAHAADECQRLWKEKSGWMYLLLPHAEMDDLEASLGYLKKGLLIADRSAALYALSHIRADLSSIQNRDALSWKNIF